MTVRENMLKLHQPYEARIRFMAIEIQKMKERDRRRQIAIEAGRHHEALRAAGFQRWQAVKAEDELAAALRARVSLLDKVKSGELPAPKTLREIVAEAYPSAVGGKP